MRQGPAVVHDDRCTGCLVRSNATYGEPSFDADRPLDADLVVVDETSMVDVILATKLVKAVAPGGPPALSRPASPGIGRLRCN